MRAPAVALVTGGSGFVGGHLLQALLERGLSVHASSRGWRDDPETSWHQLALDDADAVEGLVARVAPDVIFHLASHVTGSRELDDVRSTFEANLESTLNVLTAAVRSGCERVVLAGSMEELGGELGIPGSGYAASKLAATAYARLFHAVYGLSVVNLRVFMVYGPGQLDERKLIPYTITSLLRQEPPLLSSGDRPVDWIYVTDVVDGFLAAALATSGDDGSSIDLGSGELVTIREIVGAITARLAPAPAPVFGALPDRPYESAGAADPERARNLLGWSPATPLEQGIDATIAWYRGRPTPDPAA
jgi:UDP-glucose 4-epimerase